MLHGEAPVATGRVLKSMEMALFSNILGILSLTPSPYIYIYIYIFYCISDVFIATNNAVVHDST